MAGNARPDEQRPHDRLRRRHAVARRRQQIRTAFNSGGVDGPAASSPAATPTTSASATRKQRDLHDLPRDLLRPNGRQHDAAARVHALRRREPRRGGQPRGLQPPRRQLRPSSGVWRQGDFNYDGIVNLQDFNRLAANSGSARGGSGGHAAGLGSSVRRCRSRAAASSSPWPPPSAASGGGITPAEKYLKRSVRINPPRSWASGVTLTGSRSWERRLGPGRVRNN